MQPLIGRLVVLPCSYAYVVSETRLYLYMTEKNGHRKIGQNIIIKCIIVLEILEYSCSMHHFSLFCEYSIVLTLERFIMVCIMYTHDNTHDLLDSTG